LFTDLPFDARQYELRGKAIEYLNRTAAQNHQIDAALSDTPEWRQWRRHPSRARVWFVKGGPGQGKSTIAQYFCQLQRAALIIGDNTLAVNPTQRSLADDIRVTALAAGLWPEAPRIPISIELKQFAQWFGERAKEEPRGILTYLAQHLGAGVEEKVYPGTLKRALGMHSWLIIFDGLDEVPSDVKDDVASEVRSFVDNVLVQVAADALTICTSRPQGYSGQFADMDGPVINLIPLSRAEALACARPVLAIDRTVEDVKAYYSILERAIQSESVQQLMTTPLQAHIMAVVVRDGGKPPERRWQLFTNFYQVIKKREANRSLPNSDLAQLLSKEDKLLKALHNRLGFFLQARAETSKGAETSLNRDEFRKLVLQTVTDLKDQEIDATVNILMEATTDRLVLVSTPEQGSHVRFDIRPLQEFFAAEFIYESVNSETFSKRLEVIAADSHWREVMHFVLSALIENDRQTELTVAISALERLNEGNGETDNRLLSHRLGIGAILSSRLLLEGVLEQDKRIRQRFRMALEPMCATTDWAALSPLAAVEQPASRTWLRNLLMDSLQESKPSENVGAAILAVRILEDSDEKLAIVKRTILSCPPDYRSLVLDAIDAQKCKGRVWLIEMALRSLISPDWLQLTRRGIRAALNILAENHELVPKMASTCGITTQIAECLLTLLDVTKRRHDGESSVRSESHGFVTLKYYPNALTSHLSKWSEELWLELSQSTGILKTIYLVLKFYTYKKSFIFGQSV
jgi:hypothetical protein